MDGSCLEDFNGVICLNIFALEPKEGSAFDFFPEYKNVFEGTSTVRIADQQNFRDLEAQSWDRERSQWRLGGSKCSLGGPVYQLYRCGSTTLGAGGGTNPYFSELSDNFGGKSAIILCQLTQTFSIPLQKKHFKIL